MLRLEGLELRLGAFSLRADFELAAGALVSVTGPSGAGKSSLLSAIAGFLNPSKGRILWQGTEITRDEPSVRPLSILFQDNNLFPHLSVAQNVGLGLRPDLRLSRDQHAQVSAALARVGIGDLAARRPADLSGGQQSRAALARMLVRARPLMLFDEPFAALGPALRAEMLDLVRELATANGATVLMVTHNPEDARRLGGVTVLVADGCAQAPRETDALFADPPPALAKYLGNG